MDDTLDFDAVRKIPPSGNQKPKRHRRTKREILEDAAKYLEAKKDKNFVDVVHRLGKPLLRWGSLILGLVATVRSGFYIFDWFVQGSNFVYAFLVAVILPAVCLLFPQVIVLLHQERKKGRWILSGLLGVAVFVAMVTSLITSINGMYSDRSKAIAQTNATAQVSERAKRTIADLQGDLSRYADTREGLEKDLANDKTQEALFDPKKDWQYSYWVTKQSRKEEEIAKLDAQVETVSGELKRQTSLVTVDKQERKSNFEFLHAVDGLSPDQNEFVQTTGLASLLEIVPPLCGIVILIL